MTENAANGTAHQPCAPQPKTDRANSGGPDYVFEQIEDGATREVAPGLHWVRMPLPFALNHINLWLLKDGDGWTVVDTGFANDAIRAHWREVIGRISGGRPVGRMIVTHFHPDHLGLAGWFEKEYGAELWMSYPDWLQAHLAWTQDVTHSIDAWMAFFVRNGFDRDRAERFKQVRKDFGRWTAPVPGTVNRLWDGRAVDIGGRDWRVITGAGHSPEHAALYNPELNILISGDQVLPKITTNISVWFNEPDGNPLRQYMESFDKFRPLPDDALVLPSHGLPFRGLHARLDALEEHHAERLREAWERCDEPRTAMEVVPTLFRRELDDHQISFAMGEALAHLNYLVGEGRLEKAEGEDGLVRYRRPAR